MATAKKKPAPKKAKTKTAKTTKTPQKKTPARREPAIVLANQSIPLNQLHAWEGNVRKTLDPNVVKELEASIPAHGLIQSLIVKPSGKNKFLVITGRHRLTALQNLERAKAVTSDYPVPCQIADSNVSLEEIGLAENVIRAEMNAADQFEVFSRLLTDTTTTPADVGARFGVSETIVKKRLELGRLSPKILQGFRDGILNLEQLQAFTVITDQKKQERYYLTGDIAGRPSGKIDNDALRDKWEDVRGNTIRENLTETEICANDKRARFVGLDAYRAAGGQERQWLFSDDDSGIFLLNPEILNQLVEEKLQQLTAEVKAEGWSWVEASLTDSWDHMKFKEADPKTSKLSAADEKTVKDLEAKVKKIEDNAEDRWDLSDEDQARCDLLEDQINQIKHNAKTWTAKTKEIGGAYITLTENGVIDITRGLMDRSAAKKAEKEKEKAAKAKAKGIAPEGDDSEKDPDSDEFAPDMSKKIMLEMTTHTTFAVAATLSQNYEAGLAALLHPMVLDVFYSRSSSWDSIINVRITDTGIPTVMSGREWDDEDIEDVNFPIKGYAQLRRAMARWHDRMPEEESDVFQFLMGLKLTDLCELAALLAGIATSDKNETGRRHGMTSQIMRMFNTDMTAWYQPRAENLFNNLGKPQLITILHEIRGEPATAEEQKLKKAAFAQLVEAEAIKAEERGQPWLPVALRAPKPSEDDKTAATPPATAEAAEEPAHTFKTGDVVFETRGETTALKMTVQRIKPEGKIECVWFQGDRMREALFHHADLQLAPPINNSEEATDDDTGDFDDNEDGVE